MKCKYCGSEMVIDDKDKKFYGNYDVYWICNICISSCIVEFRYNKKYRELWHSENFGIELNEIVYNKVK